MTNDDGEWDETAEDNLPEDAEIVAEIVRWTSGQLCSLDIKSLDPRPHIHPRFVLPPCRELTMLKLDWTNADHMLLLVLDTHDGSYGQVNRVEYRHVWDSLEHFTLGYFPNLTTLVLDVAWVYEIQLRRAAVFMDILRACTRLETPRHRLRRLFFSRQRYYGAPSQASAVVWFACSLGDGEPAAEHRKP